MNVNRLQFKREREFYSKVEKEKNEEEKKECSAA